MHRGVLFIAYLCGLSKWRLRATGRATMTSLFQSKQEAKLSLG